VDLSQSAMQSLARCLIGLLAHNTGPGTEAPPKLDLSQETLAQMVGLSRETVTRVLSRLRRSRILEWKRSGLVIRDKSALEKLADFPETADPAERAAQGSVAVLRDELPAGSRS
jgi:DNA-binding FadR family transcriptional regulator